MRYWLAELNGYEVENVDLSTVILPVGSIERHGLHLPLGTDTYTVIYIAERVAERVGAVILPPIWYGVCTAMRRHKGTIDISPETLSRLVVEVLREANRNGARLAVIINGHGGNTQALHYAARVASRQADIAVAVVDWWRDVAEDTRRRLFEKPGHAGEDETSAMLAIKPELVDMRRAEIAKGDYPPYKLYYRRVEESIYSKALTGDARIAEHGKGREWLEAVVDEIVEIIGSLRSYLERNA